MNKRIDSTGFLYHWVKAEPYQMIERDNYHTAFNTFLSILRDGCIKHGDLFKTGGEPCICFTESPEYFMHYDRSKYQPFGFKFSKSYAYRLGGRTVIYSSAKEKEILPEALHWRFMLHDPISISDSRPHGVDFTWEREWRVPVDKIDISEAVGIIVPSTYYKERVEDEFDLWIESNSEYMREKTGYYEPHPSCEEYIDDLRAMLITPETLF